jgi:hypothetical protein
MSSTPGAAKATEQFSKSEVTTNARWRIKILPYFVKTMNTREAMGSRSPCPPATFKHIKNTPSRCIRQASVTN